MQVYIGWDQRDIAAYERCVRSLTRHSSAKLQIDPLRDWDLRRKRVYWRSYIVDGEGQKHDGRDGKPFSTDFSFTRFCVPLLEDYADEWVLFCDPDMLWRADVAELIALIDPTKAVMCVKHNHKPTEVEKMGGVVQTVYPRKNWSSLMLMNPSKCTGLTKYAVNNQSGTWLHGMLWAQDEMIGGLPEEWNYLCGWSDPEEIKSPKIVHFTRGTPDMEGCEDEEYAAEWWAA
jgi:hypothetical protein